MMFYRNVHCTLAYLDVMTWCPSYSSSNITLRSLFSNSPPIEVAFSYKERSNVVIFIAAIIL